MDDETIDETTDEPTTDEQTEEAVTSIDLPLDHDGTPVHVGDHVLVRGRRDACIVTSMTTDGGDSVDADGRNGWVLHVRAICQLGDSNVTRNINSHDVKVLDLTAEEGFLIEFFCDALSAGMLSYQACKDYARLITVNE